MNRIAVTGSAMLTSVGPDRDSCFEAFCAGRSGDRPFLWFDRSRFKVQKAYGIADSPAHLREPPLRATRWLCQVIERALAEARLPADVVEHVPVIVGTGLRELRSAELWVCDGQPLHAFQLHFEAAVSRLLHGKGPVITISNACSAGSFGLAIAEDMIRLRTVDAVVVAGTDSLTETMVGLADRANPLQPERLQPFDRNRKGVMLGEGAAAVVLESAEAIAKRNVEPRAWLRGVGLSCDAFHETAPDIEGIAAAMRDAHERSSRGPGQIDLLLAHGTGTALNDEAEVLAFRNVFGERATRVAISALKSMTGHTSGASALVGVVTGIECMRRGVVPPTVGLEEVLASGNDLDFVRGEARRMSVGTVQVDAFGFGGVNAVAMLEAAS